MNIGEYTFLLLVATFRLCRPQSATLNLDKLKTSVDMDGDGNITRIELQDLFVRHIGQNTSERCPYTAWMLTEYGASSPRVSALFDLMQSSIGVVRREDFSLALLGGPNITVVSVSGFLANVAALDALIDKVTTNPSVYTAGPTFWKYGLYEVDRWADNSDLDNNSYISRQELSTAMRKLDQDGDGKIMRCEFVNSMTIYKQHTVTSSKVYSGLFDQRDLMWADVDSDFLLAAINDLGGDVTKKKFADYFRKENQAAAGVTVTDNVAMQDDDSTASFSASIFLCLTSSFIVFISRLIVQ